MSKDYMQTQIQKWGNSLAIRIPIKLSHKLHIKQGSIVDINIDNNQLIISPQIYSLSDMLDSITDKNMHSIEFSDEIVGKEEW